MENINLIIAEKDRVKMVLDHFELTQSKLAKKTGISQPLISQVLIGNRGLNDYVVDKIVKAYPEVNYLFLKNGTKPMLLTDGKVKQNQVNLMTPSKGEPQTPDQYLIGYLNYHNELLEKLVRLQEENNELLAELLEEKKKSRS